MVGQPAACVLKDRHLAPVVVWVEYAFVQDELATSPVLVLDSPVIQELLKVDLAALGMRWYRDLHWHHRGLSMGRLVATYLRDDRLECVLSDLHSVGVVDDAGQPLLSPIGSIPFARQCAVQLADARRVVD